MDISYYKIVRPISLAILLSLSFNANAQGAGDNNLFLVVLAIVAAIIVLGIIIQVADNLLVVESKQKGVDESKVGLLPKIGKFFEEKIPAKIENSDAAYHRLYRGFDIKLAGTPLSQEIKNVPVTRFAMQPKNFIGMAPIPKLVVNIGDEVKAGQPIYFDKTRPEVMYVAPVSGEFIELNRAEKRSIAEIVILADKDQQYKTLEAPELKSATREDIQSFLLANGGWPLIKQRPFNIIPDSNEPPSNIFISTFDTAPLAVDLNLTVKGKEAAFQKGVDVLNTLTNGTVFLGLDGRPDKDPSTAFLHATGVQKHWFNGPHPAGNVGIQIHHIHPISSTMKVWTVSVQNVITIGNMWLEGRYDSERIISLSGSELKAPSYVKTHEGANIGELLAGQFNTGEHRIISGDVLSGQAKSKKQFLNSQDNQLTVIKEGRYNEMFGWLVPSVPKPSISKTFPGFLLSDTVYEADTNTHGERRAFVVTGQYEKVMPMDIYPQALMKAILSNDFESMEGLGIRELVEEDIALCEFVCTSKMPLQKILREGLETVREQG